MRRYQQRRRRRLGRKLAMAQGWLCPWCEKPLPPDLANTHLDHVWPRSKGGPDEEWNLQILHARCNHYKADAITPAAVALMASHEVDGATS